MNKKYFVVSDTHSYYSILRKTLKERGFDEGNFSHKLIVLGDLFDRGDESKEIFKFVKSLGDRFIYVRGNHEDLLSECYEELISSKYWDSPSPHHVHNGTLKTIANLSELPENALYYRNGDKDVQKKIKLAMKPVLKFIEEKSLNYFELSNYIFVHGWIPHIRDYNLLKHCDDYNWRGARWFNGMEEWKNGWKFESKTIVCGHFHCSWGWSHIDQKYNEFPNRGDINKLKQSFQPYMKIGIIALDACTAYSGLMNCIIIEEE